MVKYIYGFILCTKYALMPFYRDNNDGDDDVNILANRVLHWSNKSNTIFIYFLFFYLFVNFKYISGRHNTYVLKE